MPCACDSAEHCVACFVLPGMSFRTMKVADNVLNVPVVWPKTLCNAGHFRSYMYLRHVCASVDQALPHPIQNVSALYWSRCQKINRVSGHVHTPWNSQFDCTSMAVWHVYYGCCVVPVVNCFKMSLHIRTAPFAWRWEVGSQLPMPCAAIFFSFLFFFFSFQLLHDACFVPQLLINSHCLKLILQG